MTAERGPHAIARAFIAASEAGAFPAGLVCDDMIAWTTLQGEHSLARYRQSLAWMREASGGTLAFTIDAITAEADRVVIEARSTATLRGGAAYANTYVFVLRLRDGRIASVREHFNPAIVLELLLPLMR
ncbi:nuclear transport factor 2 family protein [Novosphingobium piscinae]|uniref:Nuclear transport factor 2 family protein n=1 Tax=Novosphingobium piscinae TaxID=1507448 RepID=A0A7X1FWL0_9SPHN|nr:nuclear transport factor 2 family protein [Novosphingobium piscinae]MBC2667682.1 nuclear transport factor 2 family protein [Novosphingobium piscinae]